MPAYTSVIENGIIKIARFWPNKFVWIRTSDIRSDEYSTLEGAPKFHEENPMLGMHGIRFSLAYPEILKAEFEAVAKAVQQGYKIGVMLPQVISTDEIKKARIIAEEAGLFNLPRDKFQFGVMVETPAATEVIEDICRHVNFISIGSNDLTQYTLAIDRGNEQVQNLYNEMNPAVLRQISRVIRACKKYNVESSICGQAGSKPEMAEFLVKEGISSISTNADAAKKISEIVSKAEAKLISEESEPEEALDEAISEHQISDGDLKNIEPEDIEISDGELAHLEADTNLDDKNVNLI
jgi:pyruvate,water dikinase